MHGAGLVQGEHLSVDGSFILANASTGSRIPREQLAEAAQVKRTVREYLDELQQENPVEEPAQSKIVSRRLIPMRLTRAKVALRNSATTTTI